MTLCDYVNFASIIILCSGIYIIFYVFYIVLFMLFYFLISLSYLYNILLFRLCCVTCNIILPYLYFVMQHSLCYVALCYITLFYVPFTLYYI